MSDTVQLGACTACSPDSTVAQHSCREKGYPPIRLYPCGALMVLNDDLEMREALRQLMWAAWDRFKTA